MALDPLKFAVQISDEATQELKNIKALIDGLQDKSVNISVSGNLGELLTFLKEGVDTSKFDNLKSSINEALSGLDGLNRAAKEGNFTEYAGQINTAKDAVLALANAISSVDAVVGTNEGFQKFMYSIGEVVSRVDAALKQLNESSNANGGVMGSKSIEKAKYELYQFDNLVKQAEQTSRLGKQFGDVDTTGLDKAIEKLKTYRAELDQIAQTGKGQNGRGFDKFALDAEYKKAVDQVEKLAAGQHTTEMNLGRYNAMLKETDALWDRIIAAWTKGSSLGVASANMQPAERQAHDFYARLKSLNEADLNNVQIISQLAAEFQRLKSTLTATAKEQEKLNAATEKQRAKDQADATKKTQRENEAWAKSMRDASTEANKLGIELNRLRKIEQAGSDVGADTTKLKQYISTLESYKIVLDQIAAGNRNLGHASDWISGKSTISGYDTLGNTGRLAKEAAGAVRELTAEKQRSASATSQLTNEEQRLAQALNQTAVSAKGQSQVLSDLKSMAMQYLGVWGGQQFLHNIIEIGGQLEMQRLSIGAILQNQSQANDLFEKIKGLAVQSPFGVVELDQMTKQLTAYGFKYNELFDMTKRLADISAATGTGVDRLALALGHVRSEAALSGYTLRQFSMGNVPLLAKLSEKLGKTTQEIRKMVRAKEISYEDVEGVIKDLTNEGGMFYNMQEVISQSVKAKFKNVKDAMAIMYGEMAESGMGDALKGVADALMEITKNWKDVATVMGTGVAVWAAQRAAIMAYTALVGKETAATFASISANVKKQGAMLQLANKYRVLTTAERDLLNASRANSVMIKLRTMLGMNYTKAQGVYIAAQRTIITNSLTQQLSEGKLTMAELAHMVATRKLSHEEARLIITNSSLDASMKAQMLSIIGSTRQLSRLELAYRRVGMAMKSLGSMALSFLPMAAITALIELLQRSNQEIERAKELGDSIFEASQEGLKNTRTMMQNTGIIAYQYRDGKLSDLTSSFGAEDESRAKTFLVKPEFDQSTAQQIIDEWSQYIRDYSGDPNKMLNNALKDEAGNVRMLKDQFDQLYLSVEQVANAQKGLADLADIFQNAQEDTGNGIFNEDIVDDVKDYDKALRSFNKTVINAFRNNGRAVKSGIDAARQFDAEFAKNTEGMSSYGEMLKELVDNYEKYYIAATKFKEADYGNENLVTDLIGDRGEVRGARKEMMNELDQFIGGITAAIDAGKIKLDDSTKNGLMAMFEDKFLSSLGNISEETKNELRKRFADALGIAIDDAEELTEKRLADWQKRAEKVFEINKEIKVKTKTITSIDEFAQAVQKDLKEKQEYIARNAGHITHVLNLKTSLKLDTKALNEQIIALATQVQVLIAQGKIEAAKSLNSIIQDELIPYRDALASIDENKKWLKQEGYSEKDPTKDKSKNKKDTKKSYKDPVAEEWKERIRLLKDANQLYKEWNKREGEDEALNRVRKQYGDIFEKWRTDKNVPWKDFKAEDIIEYRNYIQKIVDEAQKRYDEQRNDKAKNYGKEAEAVLREGKKLLDDIDKYDFDEKAKDFTAAATKAIEKLNKRWEIFKQTVDTTGDALLAAQLAGFGEMDQGARTAAEAMRNELVNQLKELGGADLVAKIPLDIDLNEEEVRDIFLDAIPNADAVEDYKESINALIKLYQEWQKLQQKTSSDDISIYTKIIGLANSYDAQLKKINKDLQEQLASIAANPLLSSGQKIGAGLMASADADWKKMKLSADYANLHNRAVAMSAEEYERAEKAIKDLIDKLRLLGRISPEEEISETNALNKAASERRQDAGSAFGHFITNGAQGLRDYYQKLADAAFERRSRATRGSAEWNDAETMRKKNKDKADSIDDEISQVDKTVKVLQNFSNAVNLASETLSSLGGEGSELSMFGNMLGGMAGGAQSMSSFGTGGMIVGAFLGGVNKMTEEAAKRDERSINRLMDEIKSIEGDVNTMLRLREQELGYNNNEIIQDLFRYAKATRDDYSSELYSNVNVYNPETDLMERTMGARSMVSYYNDLLKKGNGYEFQYNSLLEEREKYLETLGEQMSNKNPSDGEINETKQKIAELDQQIRFFAQDLAKELWDIDIKGWADQLSDALASAFENGENMAKAYRDTVTSIIQQMMQKMMQMAILEPMFERLQNQLFGENGKGGAFDPNNPKGSMSKVTAMIADFFGKGGEGEKAITASMEFMTAFQRGMQNAGLTVLNEASNTLSSSMQGTTEETSGLLAGYVNALRQDVSVNRILLTQFVSQMWPDYIEQFANQATAVQNIDSNVQIIMAMMQTGNGAMYEQIAAMRSRIDNVVMGIERFSIK